MKLKRLDNSGAILPLSEEHRAAFENEGILHIQRYFSESLVEQLRQELVDYRNSQFRFAGFSRFIESRNIFELDSCVSQIGSDLLQSNNVFLFDGPVGGKPACSIWIPLEDVAVSAALFHGILSGTHLGEIKAGDCVVLRSHELVKKITSGIILQVVGDAVSAASDDEALEETDAAV